MILSMPINRINVDAEPASTNDKIPVITLKGTAVSAFVKASSDFKRAEADLASLSNTIKAEAQAKYIAIRIAGTDCSSLRIMDDNGAEAVYSFQNKYSSADAEVVDAAFTSVRADASDYVVETVKPAFDAKFFLNDDGEFDKKAYEEAVKVMGELAKKRGKKNPLTFKKVVVPKPIFHETRFSKFTAQQNLKLTEALPNTQTLSAK